MEGDPAVDQAAHQEFATQELVQIQNAMLVGCILITQEDVTSTLLKKQLGQRLSNSANHPTLIRKSNQLLHLFLT